MVNISIDVTDLGGEAHPGDKVIFWRPRVGGSATHAGRVISTAPHTVVLEDGTATVPNVEPGEMRVLLQCRGFESQEPIPVVVPDSTGVVTLRALIESQFEYSPPVVSAVQQAASNASASEEAAIRAQVRSEAAADRADAKVDDAINNGANLVRDEVKQDADRAVSARQAATQSESNAKASEDAAAASESSAAASESAAKQSETNAGVSAIDARASKDAASGSAVEAGSHAESALGNAGQAKSARDEVVPLAGQVAADASATALHRDHVDGQVAAIDTAFTDSIPPYLQPDSPTGLGANYQTAIVARRDTTTGEVDFAELQACADKAKAEIRTLYAEGTVTTDQTLHLECDADLSGLTINWNGTGAGTCVRVGTVGATNFRPRYQIRLPRVICVSRPSTGYIPGSVGVEVSKVNAAIVDLPFIQNFETGLLLSSDFGSCSYNTFYLGDIWGSNHGIELRPGATQGWVNENKFIGGRVFADRSAKDLIWFNKPNSTANRPNNNWFFGVTLEGAAPEYTVNFDDGWHNGFVGCRWENSKGVRFGPYSYQNEILGGFHAETLKMVADPNSRLNVIDSANALRAEKEIKLRTQGKTYETILLRPALGQIDLGSGNSQWPETSIRWRGGNLVSMKGNAFVPDVDGGSNIGGSTMRWQDLHLSRYIRLGSLLLRDNQGTLEVANSESGPWTVIGAAGS